MTGEAGPLLSVVVPVYRTAWALPELARRIAAAAREAGLRHELVLVNDASPDDALRVAAELRASDPAVRLVPLAENLGQHRAVLAGLAAARGDWVVVMDGDLQDPPEAIPRLLAEARRGYDAVFAARIGRYQAGHRMATSRLFKGLLARLCDLPRGAGMYFLASRRMVERLVRTDDSRPFVVAQVGLASLPISAVPVARVGRPAGASAYSSWGRLRAGTAAVAFALRERRRSRRDPHSGPAGDPAASSRPPAAAVSLALGWGFASALAGFAAGRGRAFGLGDEGFRYLLSQAWAEGEALHRLFHLLYVPGQYAYFGTFLRALGPQIEVLRLAEAVLGGAATAVAVLAVGRVAGPALTAAAGAALAFATLPGYASVASAMVLAAAIDLAARTAEGRRPGPGWIFGAGVLVGLLAGWREDSAVLALAVTLAAVALRRRPLDTLRLVLPGALLGVGAWVSLFALRGEGAELLDHMGRRLLFLVERLGEPTRPAWSFPEDPFASRRALLAALFPFAAAVPPFAYAGILLRQGVRRLHGQAVAWPAAAAAVVGIAYLPQFLWERPDLAHLWAHLHLLAAIVAVAAAGERLPWRRVTAAGLGVAALLGAGFVATRGDGEETVHYPCCQGRRIGARLPDPPPWAGLSRRNEGTFLILGWGPGWYVVEGVRPPTRFLDPGSRTLTPAEIAELSLDLADPEVAWVITASLRDLPPEAVGALRRFYEPREAWSDHGWRLWRRRPG